MHVGILKIEILIPGSSSLKIKRSALKSIKDRLRTRFNVSVAEIDHNDKWQRAAIGVSVVSNERVHAERVLANVVDLVYGDRRVEVIDVTKTFL